MECFVVAEFLTSASRGPSAIAEPLVDTVERRDILDMTVIRQFVYGLHLSIR